MDYYILMNYKVISYIFDLIFEARGLLANKAGLVDKSRFFTVLFHIGLLAG